MQRETGTETETRDERGSSWRTQTHDTCHERDAVAVRRRERGDWRRDTREERSDEERRGERKAWRLWTDWLTGTGNGTGNERLGTRRERSLATRARVLARSTGNESNGATGLATGLQARHERH